MAKVLIESVTKRFGETVAVEEMSVAIRDGEFATFLGPSGCGKTTSLRMIAGFIAPDTGRIKIGDRVLSDSERRLLIPPEDRGLGMVFQSYAVWPHMTVFENVAYPLKIAKVPAGQRKERTNEVLKLVKMPELAERHPHQLSGGQQQRVALARALIMDPEVLLLDEPLSNLDAKLREEMRLEIKELQRKTEVTIVFVTHDQLEAMVLSDRVVVMDRGRVQQIGTPQEIYQAPANQFVADFIGSANFISCQWESGELRLRSSPDIILPVLPSDDMEEGGISLMVRPEHVHIAESGLPIQAEVTRQLFMGDATEYILRVGEEALRAKHSGRGEFEVGEMVSIEFENVHFFQ